MAADTMSAEGGWTWGGGFRVHSRAWCILHAQPSANVRTKRRLVQRIEAELVCGRAVRHATTHIPNRPLCSITGLLLFD